MELLKIGEIARLAGLQPSTIRYYESLGLIRAPQRVSGHRRYDRGVVDRLKVIQYAQQAGFSLSQIKALLQDTGTPSTRWRHLAHDKISEINSLIEQAQQMKQLLQESLRCTCVQLEECAIVTGACSG